MLDESAPPQLPDAPTALVDDCELERWLDGVSAELQRVHDQASRLVAAPPTRLASAPSVSPAPSIDEPSRLAVRREAEELRAWARREADSLVDETRRQVLEIYERLRVSVIDLHE